jgi:hypothetical protein
MVISTSYSHSPASCWSHFVLLLGLGEIFRGLRQQRRDDREARTGLALGAWLGLVCFGRIVA